MLKFGAVIQDRKVLMESLSNSEIIFVKLSANRAAAHYIVRKSREITGRNLEKGHVLFELLLLC